MRVSRCVYALSLFIALAILLFLISTPLPSGHAAAQDLPDTRPSPWRPETRPAADPDGFVPIRGGVFLSGDRVTRQGKLTPARLDDFEICDHPVTNAEYRLFVEATHPVAPVYWKNGQPPAGMENHPVVLVNRYDVDAYLAWRTRKEDRIYRLPTDSEFEYAARGGLEQKLYPWGDEDPAGRANFDAEGKRPYDSWRSWLKPVRSFPPNGYGLYDMAGNVWHMVTAGVDLGRSRFKFRIYSQTDVEERIVGGSWARSTPYLRCGYGAGASPGIRHPDIGFRLVREPQKNTAAFRIVPRRMVALPQGPGSVFLSWQLLPQDVPGTGFHVYRSVRRQDAGFRLTTAPIGDATCWLDTQVPKGVLHYYRVRPVHAQGTEGPPSEWVGTQTGEPTGMVRRFSPAPRKTGGAPVFGDLDGDGQLDLVLRLDNGNVEMSQDPGVPVEIEAFLGDGRYLWRRALVWHDYCFGSASDVPVNIYDLDGDGKAEVIARLQEGEQVFLAVLEGLTGRVLRKTPWPPMLTDFAKSSTRIHLSIARLDGKNPAIVTQTGLYENELFVAFDGRLNKLWEFRSTAETNGSGSHHIDIADVDGDGRDEVFDGTTCLNSDGTLRWSIYRLHPDIVAVRDFLPEHPGLEVYYVVESNIHAGVYMVDASSGRILWKINREDDPRWTHGHAGWAADIWDGSPGIELFASRDGHEIKDTLLLSAAGKILIQPFPNLYTPVEWDGDPTREMMIRDGSMVGNFDGRTVVPITGAIPNEGTASRVAMVADLCGDFRDEIVLVGGTPEGGLSVTIRTPTEVIRKKQLTRTAAHGYRMWLAHNLTGGYGSYFEAP